jgi:hypothetical protein
MQWYGFTGRKGGFAIKVDVGHPYGELIGWPFEHDARQHCNRHIGE